MSTLFHSHDSTRKRIARLLLICAVCALLAGMLGCAQQNSSLSGDSKSELASASISDTALSSSTSTAQTGTTPSETASNSAADPALAKALEADIKTVAKASDMDVSIAIIDLNTGSYAGYQATERVVSASMIKLIIAAAFLEEVEKGNYNLDDTYTLQSSDIVGGTGTIAGYGAGTQITYEEILHTMISVSDNTSANILIDALGMDTINKEAKRLGLTGTEINRLMMDTDAIAEGIENYVSANDVATLLELTYKGKLVSKKASAVLLDALEDQQDEGGIAATYPASVMFAHKTGALANAKHDGGIVEGNNPFVVVVLCSGDGFSEQGALDIMSDVGEFAYSDIVTNRA